MSADIAVFHSADADDPKLLPDGWYIAALRGDDFRLDECCVGPCATAELAYEAMASGEWLHRDNYFDGIGDLPQNDGSPIDPADIIVGRS